MRGERVPELGVAGHRGVADPVDRLDAVHHPDRVQAPPPAGGEHPGVDLQVQVPVRVAGAGGVVPHHRGLQLLDRDLHLSAPRPDPGGGVLGEPADDLGRGPVLGGVVGGGDLRVQCRGQRPGLRPVDHHLDEPQPARRRSAAAPSARRSRRRSRPPTARTPGPSRDRPRSRGDPSSRGVPRRTGGQPGALGQVVVIGPGPVGLHVRRGPPRPSRGRTSPRRARPSTARHYSSTSPEMTLGPPSGADRSTDLRSMRAARFEGLFGLRARAVIQLVSRRQGRCSAGLTAVSLSPGTRCRWPGVAGMVFTSRHEDLVACEILGSVPPESHGTCPFRP